MAKKKSKPDMNELYLTIITVAGLMSNRTRWKILQIINKEPNISITELAEQLGITYPNVYGYVKELKESGAITTKKHSSARGQKVTLQIADNHLLKDMLQFKYEHFKNMSSKAPLS